MCSFIVSSLDSVGADLCVRPMFVSIVILQCLNVESRFWGSASAPDTGNPSRMGRH